MPQHVRGVGVAVDVDFERRVHRDHAEPADDAGVVGHLLRAAARCGGEEVHVVDERCSCRRVRVSEVALAPSSFPASIRSTSESWKTSVYIKKGGMSGCSPRAGQHGVGDVAHAGLQRQELRRDAPGAHLAEQEVHDVPGDPAAGLVGLREGGHLVGLVGLDDADRSSAGRPWRRACRSGQRVEDRDRVAVRRRRHDDDVGHLAQARRWERLTSMITFSA